MLGVPREVLRAHGAVSRETAEAMALGAARSSGSELALAITGIAGPDGGSEEKPVGLVWCASVFRGEVRSSERRLPPIDRDSIRRVAARTALFLGWKRLPRRVRAIDPPRRRWYRPAPRTPLPRGVTVTLQVLVLSFLVRIQAG